MKKYKTAKKAKVKFKKVVDVRYICSYQCPHCHHEIIGDSISKRITRFKCCKCDNEIIVDSN